MRYLLAFCTLPLCLVANEPDSIALAVQEAREALLNQPIITGQFDKYLAASPSTSTLGSATYIANHNESQEKILAALLGAEKEVLISTRYLTNLTLLRELIRLRTTKQLKIVLINDRNPPVQKYQVPNYLLSNGILVFSNTKGINHDSFIIIDRKQVFSSNHPYAASASEWITATQHYSDAASVNLFLRRFITTLNSHCEVPDLLVKAQPKFATDLVNQLTNP